MGGKALAGPTCCLSVRPYCRLPDYGREIVHCREQPFPPLLALIPRTVWSVFTYAPH